MPLEKTSEWTDLFEPSFDEISLFHGRVKNPKRRAAEQVFFAPKLTGFVPQCQHVNLSIGSKRNGVDYEPNMGKQHVMTVLVPPVV